MRKEKEKIVERIVEGIRGSKTIGVGNLTSLPDRHFQLIRKKLRGKVKFIVSKSTLISLAMEKAKKSEELKMYLNSPSVLILSDMNPFQLYKLIKENRGTAFAKPGQISPCDIIVEEGETTLPPGPVLSELKLAGINAQIKGGKVVINKECVVVKGGERVSEITAKALQKLDIRPFEVMLNIPAIWENGILYSKEILDISQESFLSELKSTFQKALNLSLVCTYPTKQNINILLQRGMREAENLAYNSNIYEKGVMGPLLKKAYAQASVLEKLLESS